jgi:hypothetical protein
MADYGYDGHCDRGRPAIWYLFSRKITDLVIEEGVTHIGDRTFPGFSKLRSVTIPGSVTSIGKSAFSDCFSLTSITIPNSVTVIANFAFSGCMGLTSVMLPSSVTSINREAFYACTNLTSITVATDNAHYSSVDGVLFNKNKTTLILYPEGRQGAYTIPNSVISIGNRAFSRTDRRPIELSPIVNGELPSYTGLTSVTIPNSVTSIGDYAFYYCCVNSLTSLTIPSSVTFIGEGAFYYCAHLTSVISLNPVPPNIGRIAFAYIPSSACLYVSEGSIRAYQEHDIWKEFKCIKSI